MSTLISPPHLDAGSAAFRTPSPPQMRQIPRSSEDLDGDIILMIKQGIRAVCFDLDMTLLSSHTQGCCKESEVKNHADNFRPEAKLLIPLLLRHGIDVCIVTFSDHEDVAGHIGGEVLVRRILGMNFHPTVAKTVRIAAGHPESINEVRRSAGKAPVPFNKHWHFRKLFPNFHRAVAGSIMFFDDTEKNVVAAEAEGIRTTQVSNAGFVWGDWNRLVNAIQSSAYTQQ